MRTEQKAELPTEGAQQQADEHGTLNQKAHLSCLGLESLSCLSQQPHCPHSPGFVAWPEADSDTNDRKDTQGAGQPLKPWSHHWALKTNLHSANIKAIVKKTAPFLARTEQTGFRDKPTTLH